MFLSCIFLSTHFENVQIIIIFLLKNDVLPFQVVQATGGPELASSVLSPLLTKDTIDFLNYTVNADERQLWMSLGDSWMKPR